MRRLLAVLAVFALVACNHTPPNVSPVGQTAIRVQQLIAAIDTVGDVAVEAEANGLIKHADTLKVADVVEKSARAAADLGRALQAGGSSDTAKEKAIAIIREALAQLPGNLSPEASKKVAPFINIAQAILNVIG